MKPFTRFTALALLATSASLHAVAASPAGNDALTRGDQLWAQGRTQEARAAFEQAVKTSKQPLPALLQLGGLLLANQDFGPAIATYKQALGLDGRNVRAWMGLGLAYLHTQQKDLSRAAFAEVLRIDPSRKAQLAELADATTP